LQRIVFPFAGKSTIHSQQAGKHKRHPEHSRPVAFCFETVWFEREVEHQYNQKPEKQHGRQCVLGAELRKHIFPADSTRLRKKRHDVSLSRTVYTGREFVYRSPTPPRQSYLHPRKPSALHPAAPAPSHAWP